MGQVLGQSICYDQSAINPGLKSNNPHKMGKEMRCERTKILFTAFTIRRPSAAHGCATARTPTRAARGAVGTMKSMSGSGKVRGFQGD